jgi:hypothetical protein
VNASVKAFIEDDNAFMNVEDVTYEAFPFPVRWFMKKEKFRILVGEIRDRYV